MLLLNRIRSSADGTFGILSGDGQQLAVTCELPWNNNLPGTSCIPSGIYYCTPHNGTKFTNVWGLDDVPGRWAILIHNGNTIQDTDGCILVGEEFGEIAGKPAILNSVKRLNMLRVQLPPSFALKISNIAEK